MDLPIGKIVQVELPNEILVGRLTFCDKKLGVLELNDVRNFNSGCPIACSQILTLKQIRKVVEIEEEDDDNQCCANDSEEPVITKTCSDINDSLAATSNGSEEPTYLTADDLDLIAEQIDNLLYIKYTDEKYHMAIKSIRSQAEVAVCLEPNNVGRHGVTSLITIATHTAVYIFDMQCLGSQCRELCAVLEAKRPRKVVHGSHHYTEQLRGMRMKYLPTTGLFDTSVAYCFATRSKEPIEFREAIYKCFNISPKFLTAEDFYSYERPLEPKVLRLIAKRAILQLKLQEFLLYEKLLMPLNKQFDQFARTFTDCTPCEAIMSPLDKGYESLTVSWDVGDD